MNWRWWKTTGGSTDGLPVHDLDDVVQRPMPIILHGKRREIVAIDLDVFLDLANSLAMLNKSANSGAVRADDLIDAYFDVFRKIVKPILRNDVERMTQAQIAGLFSLVLGRVQGDTESTIEARVTDASKKKSARR